MTNVELLKQGYSNFAAGKLDDVLALWEPNIEWHECKGMPFIKGDGLFVGADAIVTNVFMKIPLFIDGFNITISELFGADDKVVMVGYYNGTNKATGKAFKANATHVWTLKNGKVASFFQAADTVTITG